MGDKSAYDSPNSERDGVKPNGATIAVGETYQLINLPLKFTLNSCGPTASFTIEASAHQQPPTPECKTHWTFKCENDVVYWYDSCGKKEDVWSDCASLGLGCNQGDTSGECINKCPITTQKTCYDGDIYYLDACGEPRSLVQNCAFSETCRNNECVKNCILNYEKMCKDNKLYWVDTCGNFGDLYQECKPNERCEPMDRKCIPICDSHAYKACDSMNNLYWKDSCDQKEEKIATCSSSQLCTPNGCIEKTPCGNGVCDVGETCATCPGDCGGECAFATGYCGDGTCKDNETCQTCTNDCGNCNLKKNIELSPSPINNIAKQQIEGIKNESKQFENITFKKCSWLSRTFRVCKDGLPDTRLLNTAVPLVAMSSVSGCNAQQEGYALEGSTMIPYVAGTVEKINNVQRATEIGKLVASGNSLTNIVIEGGSQDSKYAPRAFIREFIPDFQHTPDFLRIDGNKITIYDAKRSGTTGSTEQIKELNHFADDLNKKGFEVDKVIICKDNFEHKCPKLPNEWIGKVSKVDLQCEVGSTGEGIKLFRVLLVARVFQKLDTEARIEQCVRDNKVYNSYPLIKELSYTNDYERELNCREVLIAILDQDYEKMLNLILFDNLKDDSDVHRVDLCIDYLRNPVKYRMTTAFSPSIPDEFLYPNEEEAKLKCEEALNRGQYKNPFARAISKIIVFFTG